MLVILANYWKMAVQAERKVTQAIIKPSYTCSSVINWGPELMSFQLSWLSYYFDINSFSSHSIALWILIMFSTVQAF